MTERRRIDFEGVSQLALPLSAPLERRRPALDDDGPQPAKLTSGPAPGTKWPAAVMVGEALGVDRNAFLFGTTDYSRDIPPSSGYWEVRQRSARAPDGHNWWYSAPLHAWHRGVPQQESRKAQFVPHVEFIQAFEWRGMKQAWPAGYDYPLEQRPFGTPALAGDMVTSVTVVGKMEVGDLSAPRTDLNPGRRRVAL